MSRSHPYLFQSFKAIFLELVTSKFKSLAVNAVGSSLATQRIDLQITAWYQRSKHLGTASNCLYCICQYWASQ